MRSHLCLVLPMVIFPALLAYADENRVTNTAADKVMDIEDVKRQAVLGIDFISNEELKARIKRNPKLILLDVRTETEYHAGHMRGAAWVERGIAEFVLARTLPDPNAEIIVYCKAGYRTGLVVKSLRAIGYHNVSAHVGFDAWVQAGNTYVNHFGESGLLIPSETNAAAFKPDYYLPKE
jgi:rhodanese-related sulfurtransferase